MKDNNIKPKLIISIGRVTYKDHDNITSILEYKSISTSIEIIARENINKLNDIILTMFFFFLLTIQITIKKSIDAININGIIKNLNIFKKLFKYAIKRRNNSAPIVDIIIGI